MSVKKRMGKLRGTSIVMGTVAVLALFTLSGCDKSKDKDVEKSLSEATEELSDTYSSVSDTVEEELSEAADALSDVFSSIGEE